MLPLLIDIYRYVLHYLPHLLFAAPCIYWAASELRTDRQWKWFLGILGCAGVVIASALIFAEIPLATRHGLSAVRLAPAASWIKGYRLYYPVTQGPIVIQMYGPFSAIVYLPAVLVASSPTTAIVLATLTNALLYLAPAIGFLLLALRGRPGWVVIAVVALFLLITCRQFVLFEAATRVTIDSPALAFATCALAVVVRPAKRHFRNGLLCGVFVAMAIWTKLTFVSLLPPIAAYVLLAMDFRSAARFAAGAAITLFAITAVLLLCFGRELVFQNLILPMHQPWKWPNIARPDAYLRALRWMWRYSAPAYLAMLGGIGALLLSLRHRAGRSAGGADADPGRERPFNVGGLRRSIAASPWLPPAFASICLLFTATLAYVKAGGSWNNAVAGSYLALLAAAAAVGRACGGSTQSVPDSERPVPLSIRISRIFVLLLLIATGWPGSDRIAIVRDGINTWGHLSDNEHEAAYQYARTHPGEVYFPGHPLSTLLAEGKLYHFDGGISEVELAGGTVGQAQLEGGLPPHLREILYPAGGRAPQILWRFPDFTATRQDPQMPGWIIRTHEDPAYEVAPR
jgi:hypothetical protein